MAIVRIQRRRPGRLLRSCLGPILFLLAASSAAAADHAVSRPHDGPDPAACRRHHDEIHAGTALPQRREAMAREIEDYQALVEKVLSLRAQAIRFYHTLRAKMANAEPLSGADLLALREGSVELLAQRQALLDAAQRHECWTSGPPAADAHEAAMQVAGVALSLSAALVLYDNYLFAIAPYHGNQPLRLLLNRSDRGFELEAGRMNEIVQSFGSMDKRQRVRHALSWLHEHEHRAAGAPIPGYRYLRALIEQSPSLALTRGPKPLPDIFSGIGSITRLAVDALFSFKDEGTHVSSLLFGNAIGLVETRQGKLYRQPEMTGRVRQALRAGDILVEKTPFRLTDTFIPGHWGHAAIWIGGESELKALKVWDHPVVRPYQAMIRNGHAVAEALRSGVELNTLEQFMNIDDLGVLRHETIDDERRAAVILLALRQIGKPYDFNYDAETTHRVFCSKLVYLAYGELQWPTSRIMGRVTVSPDNIAARSLGNGPLRIALLYHDGQEITEKRQEFMRRLLRGPAPASR